MFCLTKSKERIPYFPKTAIFIILIWISAISIQDGLPKTNNQFLKIENGQFILNNEPFVMKGFNYYPRNYAWSSMTEWSWNEVDDELDKGATLGANILRTFIDYPYSVGDPDMISDDEIANCFPTPEYIAAIDTFLMIADAHNLKVMFSLFDYMPGWAFINKREDYIQYAKMYLDSLAGHFKNDTRIIAWDILNEGDLLPEKYKQDSTTFSMVLNFYQDIYDTLKIIDPNHKITAVFNNIDSLHKTYNFTDFISFQFPDTDQAVYGELIRNLKASIRNKEKPIVSAEFSHSTRGSIGASEREHTIRMTNYYDHCLNVDRSKLNGALFWTLMDFSDRPKTNLTRMTIPVPHSERFELYKGILDLNLETKTSYDLIKKYYERQFDADDRLDFKYSKIRKGKDLYENDKRHFAIEFHDKIEFLTENKSVIDFITFSDTSMTKHLPGQGWYLLEKWDSLWGQKGGNMDSLTSMYIDPPENTHFIRFHLSADSSNTDLEIVMSEFPLDTITLTKNQTEYIVLFNYPPGIINLTDFSFANDQTYTISLDTCVTDKNHPPEDMMWDITPANSQLKLQRNNNVVIFSAPDWNDSTNVKFIVTDPQGAFDSVTVKAFVELPTKKATEFVNIPDRFFLEQNYPNPFNPTTTIEFEIPETSEIKIRIYNLKGQMVEEIFTGKVLPGYHSIHWKAAEHPSGLYFIRLDTENFIQVQKCLLLK